MDTNGIEEMLSEIISTVGGLLNTILAALVNFFNAIFSFLPAHLRTGVGVVAFIVLGVIIFFLWRRD